jgi:hypothetical protein
LSIQSVNPSTGTIDRCAGLHPACGQRRLKVSDLSGTWHPPRNGEDDMVDSINGRGGLRLDVLPISDFGRIFSDF